MHRLRQRWSNDEMRATDERKRERETEGGSDSWDTEIEQAESRSSDNRAGSVTRLPQTHRKSSFPVGLRMHRVAQLGHVRPVDRPTGQLGFCWAMLCRLGCNTISKAMCYILLHFLVGSIVVSEPVTQAKRNSECGCGFITLQLEKGHCPEMCVIRLMS